MEQLRPSNKLGIVKTTITPFCKKEKSLFFLNAFNWASLVFLSCSFVVLSKSVTVHAFLFRAEYINTLNLARAII